MSEKKMCGGCPFNYGSTESEYAQSMGCLPSPYEILNDMHKTGKNWACHDNSEKICKGLLNFVDDMNDPLNQHVKERYNIPDKVDFTKELLHWEDVHTIK